MLKESLLNQKEKPVQDDDEYPETMCQTVYRIASLVALGVLIALGLIVCPNIPTPYPEQIHTVVEQMITTTDTYTQSTVGELNSTWVECYEIVHFINRLRGGHDKLRKYSWLCAREGPNCVGIAMKDSGVAYFLSQQPNSTSLGYGGSLPETECDLTEDWLAYAKTGDTPTPVIKWYQQ